MTKRKDWRQLSTTQRGILLLAGIVEIVLLVIALLDLRRRPAEQIRGSKRLWTLVAFINYVGPVTYFLVGRKRAG